MRDNVYEFLKLVAQCHKVSPVIEFGSRNANEEDYKDLRKVFTARPYSGRDIIAGEGVDAIDDLTKSTAKKKSVGTLLVCETLEHVFAINDAISEIKRMLSPDGLAVITIPGQLFPIHHCPDFWRLTPQCLSQLLYGLHHYIIYQGMLSTPHHLMAIAGHDRDVVGKVAKHVRKNASKIPLMTPDLPESLYEWSSESHYVNLRKEQPIVLVVK